tara:strand:- start:540 stop:986 length:447 start_codon:yes stop_codon:yes gene_type:complete
MIYVACDPSTKDPAFAMHKDGAWTIWKNPMDIHVILKELRLARGRRAAKLVVEDQYFYRNPKTMARLVGARVVIETLASLAGYEVCKPVLPSKWQSSVLGVSARTKRDERKLKAIEAATAETGLTLDSDESDAVCMALWLINGEEENG